MNLTPAQTRALEALNAKGVLYYGNEENISLSTIRALAMRGLATVTGKVYYRTSSWGRTVPHREWTARPVSSSPSNV